MESDSKQQKAEEAELWWKHAYDAQMRGELDVAIGLYTKSIEIEPTAEAYTFRGWVKSFQGHLDEAIADCHRAIEVDPEFGNPYNDIGAYLMQQGDMRGAVPWLERALKAKRYECYFYPHFNLGRIYEQFGRADACYELLQGSLGPEYELSGGNERIQTPAGEIELGGEWPVVSGQWPVVSGQWPVASGQWSVASG